MVRFVRSAVQAITTRLLTCHHREERVRMFFLCMLASTLSDTCDGLLLQMLLDGHDKEAGEAFA